MRVFLLLMVAVLLTPAICEADVVWNGSRYVFVQPANQYPATNYSRDYSRTYNRTDYALGINRYSSQYSGYGYSNYGWNSPSYQWGYSLGRRLRGCR